MTTGCMASVEKHRESAFHLVSGLVREVWEFQDGELRDDVAVVSVGVAALAPDSPDRADQS